MRNAQRYPLRLIDKVLEVQERRARALKNVSLNEKALVGHFPGRPIFPGVYVVEGVCQTAQLLMDTDVAVTAKLEDFKFIKPITPGDTIIYEAELTLRMGKFYILACRATVDGTVVATGRVTGATLQE